MLRARALRARVWLFSLLLVAKNQPSDRPSAAETVVCRPSWPSDDSKYSLISGCYSLLPLLLNHASRRTLIRRRQLLVVSRQTAITGLRLFSVRLCGPSVERQGQGLEIGALGQCRMDRVIGIGAGDPQDAAGAAGIGEAAAHRLRELRRPGMERARCDEEEAVARGHGGSEP